MKNIYVVFLCFIMFVSIFGFLIKTVDCIGENWLTGFLYRKSHTILSASGADTNYQIYIIAYYDNGFDTDESVYLNELCTSNFGDVRFTEDDGITQLSYWIENKEDSNYAEFWVKINENLTNDNSTIYIYFGKFVSTTSNPYTTLEYYNDFEGDSLGASPSGFLSGGGYYTVSDITGQQGTKCIYQSTSNVQSFFDMEEKGKIRIKVMVKTASPYQFSIISRFVDLTHYLYCGAGYGNPAVYFTATEVDVSTYHNYTSFTYGTDWHEIEIWTWNTDLICEINGSYERKLTLHDEFSGLCGLSAWNNVKPYFDYIRIWRYVYPEPAHGEWGSLESYTDGNGFYDAEEGDMLIMAFILIVVLFGGLFLIIITKQKTSD